MKKSGFVWKTLSLSFRFFTDGRNALELFETTGKKKD
jgi:hypothetical protein